MQRRFRRVGIGASCGHRTVRGTEAMAEPSGWTKAVVFATSFRPNCQSSYIADV
jgi:hypothetical protein